MGAVGETALHTCLLKSTSIHADLAKWLLKSFPKLINDIYISDEYYGENEYNLERERRKGKGQERGGHEIETEVGYRVVMRQTGSRERERDWQIYVIENSEERTRISGKGG